jgi:hypothetical protein
LIPAGIYQPAFREPTEPASVMLSAFLIDRYPVTNADFLQFVAAKPDWQRSRVKRLFADENYLGDWAGDLDLGNARPNGPMIVGSQLDFVAQFLGRRLAYTYEVVEWVPGERLVMRTADGPFPMETTYTWEPIADGATRMTLRNRGNPSGFSRVAGPVMERAMWRATSKDLARLKEILEFPEGRL